MTWDDIAALYGEIELSLIASLKRNLAGHKKWEEAEGFDWPAWQALKLRNIENFRRENAELLSRRADLIHGETEKLMREEFAQGSGKSEGVTDESFFGVNKYRNDALIEDILGTEKRAESAALRMMDDVYRQTVYKAHIAMSAGSVTLPQAVDMATKDFLARGIDCIVYADGSRHNIADYVQMALRTAATRSKLQGEAQKRMELGIDTVLVSRYGACSDTCLPWQGKVYIDDVFMPFEGERRGDEGRSKNGRWYTLLSVAVRAGLLHPNCRHTLSTWIEGINTVPAPLDEEKVRRAAKLEAQQRRMEREIRKWKRLEAGTQDPAQKKAYGQKVKQAQKNLREFIADHPQELRRDPWREKIYETSPKVQVKPKLSAVKKEKDLKPTAKSDTSPQTNAQKPKTNTENIENSKSPISPEPPNEGVDVGLSDEDRYAIDIYKSARSYHLNAGLRGELPLTEEDEQIIGRIEKALEKLPKYKGTVYRSLQSDMIADVEKFNREHQVGKFITYPAFTSAGTEVYDDSMDIQMIIESKSGHDMREYNPLEKEILFLPGTLFKITKREGNTIWLTEL